MPTWELYELLTCKWQCSLDISEDKVRNRFAKWGGIPRFVLEDCDAAELNVNVSQTRYTFCCFFSLFLSNALPAVLVIFFSCDVARSLCVLSDDMLE